MEERGKSNWLTRKYILTICYRGIFSLDVKIFQLYMHKQRSSYDMEKRGKTNWLIKKIFIQNFVRVIKNGVSLNMNIFQLYIHKQRDCYDIQIRGDIEGLLKKKNLLF